MFSINENEYAQMTDEKLIENIKKDDQTALNCLMERYNDIVNMKANKFFMIGAEKGDTREKGYGLHGPEVRKKLPLPESSQKKENNGGGPWGAGCTAAGRGYRLFDTGILFPCIGFRLLPGG